MNEDKLEEIERIEPMNTGMKYQVVSRTYYDNFNRCVLLILNTETGEVKKKDFKLGK